MSTPGRGWSGGLQTRSAQGPAARGMGPAAGGIDVSALDSTITSLERRQFVLHRTEATPAAVPGARWAMSYPGSVTGARWRCCPAAQEIPVAGPSPASPGRRPPPPPEGLQDRWSCRRSPMAWRPLPRPGRRGRRGRCVADQHRQCRPGSRSGLAAVRRRQGVGPGGPGWEAVLTRSARWSTRPAQCRSTTRPRPSTHSRPPRRPLPAHRGPHRHQGPSRPDLSKRLEDMLIREKDPHRPGQPHAEAWVGPARPHSSRLRR